MENVSVQVCAVPSSTMGLRQVHILCSVKKILVRVCAVPGSSTTGLRQVQ